MRDCILKRNVIGKHPFQMILAFFVVIYISQYLMLMITGNEKQETLVILGFHNVVSDQEKKANHKQNMWVDSVSAFEEKLRYLYEQGYQTLSLDEVYEWKQGTREIDAKSVVLTFDDGYLASSYLIAPILAKYNFCAATFVVGNTIESGEHVWDGSKIQFMNMQDMKDQSIMKYYSHTYNSHDKVNGKFLIDVKSKEALQEDFDLQKQFVDTDYFAYPYGYFNDKQIEVLKQNNVKLAFGYHENRKASRDDDNYKLPRFAITAYTNMEVFKAMLNSR